MTGPEKNNSNPASDNRNFSAAELRDARRKARKLGLNPKNGLEAAKMLIQQGVEFGDSKAAKAAPQEKAAAQPASPQGKQGAFPMTKNKPDNLPVKRQAEGENLPAVQSREERQKEINKLQQNMMSKRSRRMRAMFARFFGFIMFPTLLFAIYQYNIATPLYATNSEMKIVTAVGSSGAGQESMFDLGNLMGDEDSIGLQNFLESGVIFDMLEKDYDLPKLFMGDEIDRFSRIDPEATKQDRYKLYKKYVTSSYDTTERLLKLEVKTPEAEPGKIISDYVISYAEEQMETQSNRTKLSQVEQAEEALKNEQIALEMLKREKLTLQQDLESSPDAIAATEGLKSELLQRQVELREAESIVRQMEANAAPNAARLKSARDQVRNIELIIKDIQAGFEQTGTSGRSTLELQTEMIIIESEIAAKVATVEAQQTAFTAAKAAYQNQKKFLETTLPPDTSFEPVYPKKLFSVIAVFFILFSTYLFIGMTIEVIREQMSA